LANASSEDKSKDKDWAILGQAKDLDGEPLKARAKGFQEFF